MHHLVELPDYKNLFVKPVKELCKKKKRQANECLNSDDCLIQSLVSSHYVLTTS